MRVLSRPIRLLNPNTNTSKSHQSMAKNHTTRSASCERIRKATFGRFRRADTKPRVSYTQPMALRQPVSNEIPIESVPPTSVRNVRFSSPKNDEFSGKVLVDHKTFGESRFDSFIGRVKMRMSANSDVGAVKTMNKHDTFNEKVSNFIDQAKIKFRATATTSDDEK